MVQELLKPERSHWASLQIGKGGFRRRFNVAGLVMAGEHLLEGRDGNRIGEGHRVGIQRVIADIRVIGCGGLAIQKRHHRSDRDHNRAGGTDQRPPELSMGEGRNSRETEPNIMAKTPMASTIFAPENLKEGRKRRGESSILTGGGGIGLEITGAGGATAFS